MTLQNKLTQAANIRQMATDTIQGLNRIDRDIAERLAQFKAGLISESEAIQLVKQG